MDSYSSSLESKTVADNFRNFTGILQEKFPGIDFCKIPGTCIDGTPNGTEDLETRTNFAVFMCSLIFAMFWITYITFFNSRVVGTIVTKITNRFVSVGYVKIGSLSWSILPGKVLFRDVLYMTPDFTVRVQDGFLTFRWWRSYVPKDVSEDLSHSDTRVSIQLNGFELHIYNRTSTYKELEKKFGIFTGLFGNSDDENEISKEASSSNQENSSNFLLGKNWRDLIPVVKVDITAGKFAFGNKSLPTTLVISVEEGRCTYSTKPAVCALDHFMHFLKCKADNFKILLAPSPKYTGLRDEAPRFMGEGFVVAASNDVDIYYYMDEAGLVQVDMPDWAPVPEWGVDIKCGKGTNFSYGPWADRQRELLYKFFFPPDYQIMKPTPEPRPGEKRIASMFRVRLSTQHLSTLDVLFSKAKETKAVHVDIGQGTNFEVKIPWIINEAGYQTKLNGTLMMIEATTSLPFRDLLRSETLQINVDMNYPMKWNAYQEWIFTFTASKSTLHFIFAHKWYFQDLIDDWSAKSPPDLLYFVPYTWKFQFLCKKFELVTLANEYNWVDTSSTNQENSLLAVCGEHLNIKFELPYTEFLPPQIPFVFQIEGDQLDLSLFVPQVYTSHDILKSLDINAKLVNKDGKVGWKRDQSLSKWRNFCDYDEGWFDCWTAPQVQLEITFLYHPIPLGGPPPQAEISTPEKENKLLSPLRVPPRFTKSATRTSLKAVMDNFDPGLLTADKCIVNLKVDSSTAFLYGTLIRTFMHVKENLFGEDQVFTPMDVVTNSSENVHKSTFKLVGNYPDLTQEEFDPRLYRPIEVILDINIGDLQAHLIKNCLPDDPPCPFLVVEKLVFEMDKNYRETRLQLQLSPVVLRSCTNSESQGHLLLTGLQFRGHAMFSDIDRPLGSDTLEYAWLIEIQCGSLFGKVTTAQLYNILLCLETFIFLTVDKENVLKHPRPFKLCQHNENQKDCSKTDELTCDTEADLKYKLARFSLDAIDVNITDKSSALRLQICPLRFSTCNLHGLQTKQGITALVNEVLIQQYVNSNFPLSRADFEPSNHSADIWIESGCVRFGPVYIEGSQSGSFAQNAHQSQHDFLTKHDKRTVRLWFLWPKAHVSNKVKSKEALGKCGCVGGCSFFGANENGIGFFKPSRNDIERKCNVAIPVIKDKLANPGYGQSILKDNTFTVRDCRIFQSFAVMGEQLLPSKWPQGCHEATKLPFCPDYRTYKSSSSNNSSETPKHPRHHRSFSGKHGKTREDPAVKRIRSVSSSNTEKRPQSQNSKLEAVKSEAEVLSLRSDVSKYTLARTESLISDVLSFYSLDGTEEKFSQSENSSKTAQISLSPTSTQYETAPESTISNYETAQDRSSSLSFDTATLQAESPQNTLDEEDEDTLSRTLSENSFMSAMSEHEDFGLVNLHMQVNKPITDSPLLMSSYISHLSQYRVSHWDETVSVLRSDPVKTNTNIFPKFDMLEEGLSCIKMNPKDKDSNPVETQNSSHFDWDKIEIENQENKAKKGDKGEENITFLSDATSKTTVIVKFKGAIDLVITPVVLESVQRMFDSITPTFQHLHPSSVVNHLHSQSLDRVEAKNTLMKKEKSLDLQEKFLDTSKEFAKNKSSKKDISSPSSDMLRTFEKSVSSYVQASVHLPRINFLSLQASVVEEMCAFSALDNVRDITCVSLLALGIQETTFQFCKTSQAKKTVQMYFQKPLALTNKKKKKMKMINQDYRLNEPFTFESSESQKEELLMTGSLQRAHAQLRRLRNDTSILKDAYITAIPHHKSKVFFKYSNVPKLSSFRSSTPVDEDENGPPSTNTNRNEESKLGFNMCECGFEGIAIKVAKRSSNQEEIPQESINLLDKSENEDSIEIENEIPPKRGEERPDLNFSTKPENVQQNVETEKNVGGKHSTASGSVELKTSWFNFAAPPKTPISRKIDFTKLDWNLLSTASPSIDAWLNPIDRLQETANLCMSSYHRRVGAVMASLMAESLDVAAENFLKPTKYDKLTSLSKTLRDDPSCQLCTILVKYMMKLEKAEIEANLDDKSVPPLTILRQGIVVLSRQWKNAIYTPILIEYNLRSKGFKNLYSTNLDPILEDETEDEDESENSDVENGENEEFDEETLLLKKLKNDQFGARFSPSHFPPLLEEQLLIYKRPGSVESLESFDPVNSVSDNVMSGDKNEEIENIEETLYDWMKRQQTEKEVIVDEDSDIVTIKFKESLNNGSGIISDITPPTPQTKQMHLLDAHIIFEPLLSSLGLMPQQIQNLSLKNLGSNVSILTDIETFRIDIVESEFGKLQRSKKSKNRNTQIPDQNSDPAFICQKVYMQIDLKKITDLDIDNKEKMVPLYMSRAQLKRHTSTLINFSIDIHFISQKVNMPLLRLLNQIVTMHMNVKETNEELREKRPIDSKPPSAKSSTTQEPSPFTQRHKRSSSGSSTSSNLSVSRQAETPNFTDTSSRRTIQTPSPSVMVFKQNIRARPKSFAQKFRPNSRLAGYTSGESPIQEQVQDSFILTSAPLERIAEEQNNAATKCWKTMYNLLELYSTMPVTKTVQRHSLTPVSNLDTGILLRPGRKNNLLNNMSILVSGVSSKTPEEVLQLDLEQNQPSQTTKKKTKGVSFAKADTLRYEHTPVIVFGIAKIKSVKLTAMLSGLKLEGEIRELQSSLQYKEKIRAPQRGVVEASIVGNMQETNIALLEGIPGKIQTIVKIIFGRSQLLYSSQMWKTKDKNSGTLKVDLIQVDIPQHPVDLHSIVTRGTKELSSTLQEFRGVRNLQRSKTIVEEKDPNESLPSPKISAASKREEEGRETPEYSNNSMLNAEESNLIRPFVMQFHITFTKLTMSAALLPSLQAEYCMENVISRGVTGSKAKFIIDLGKHSLSFTTKLQDIDNLEANLPSEASIDLPNVHINAEYIQDERPESTHIEEADGSILSAGNYLKAEADIGELEHCLTTDLLNHLVFVQKVFMKEVNDVVQKMSGSDRPVPVWTEFGEEFVTQTSAEKQKPLLFSVAVRLKNITITATTPANSGVRFETGVSELNISNRVENVKRKNSRIFTEARVNIKLSLGQIIRDTVYYEAETQFQTQAYFKTTIQMSNAIQGRTETGQNDKDVIHINLIRPLVFVQPVAVDRAILFWLSYKNAWEYWTEQRLNLNKEVLVATEQVLEKVPISQITSHLSSQQVGTLFLQLKVQDIGLCIPFLTPEVSNMFPSSKLDMDSRGAIVATVESSSISACSAGSTVSTGKFTELCIRFADDFNHTLDDWKPVPNDPNLMNLCFVSEGSYKVCSQTEKALKEENAKWFLNIQWEMTGVDVHVDTNIGKHLTALGQTLTTLTGEQEFDNDDSATDRTSTSEDDDSEALLAAVTAASTDPPASSHAALKRQKTLQQVDLDLPFLDDPKIEKNELAKYLEQEINEQAKVVEDLQKLGASEPIVVSEMKKLQVLQAIASKNFRQDLVQKLRRQKNKASYIRDKFGLGPSMQNHKLKDIGKSKSVAATIKEDPILEETFVPKLKKIASGEIFHDDFEFQKTSPSLTRESTFEEKVDYDESPHFPRDKSKYTLSPSKLAQNSSKTPLAQPEPNVDFEFHVKIFIKGGKCVLHTSKEEDAKRGKMKKDRSFSGAFAVPPNENSPNLSRKLRPGSDLRGSYMSTSRLRDIRQIIQDVTTFYIPGLDVRVHYISKVENEESLFFDPASSFSRDSISGAWMSAKRPGAKKATLSAWMTLQSIPEETIITPNILEFLEQALEPIPTFNVRDSNPEETNDDLFEDSSSGSHAGQVASPNITSFPVEVIVYFHMQSSTFRFSCIPVSRVECMLRMPSLDMVFSSKSADCELDDSNENVFSKSANGSKHWNDDSPDQDHSRGSLSDESIVSGGLSVTGCLNDFSLYVFHPYGAGRKQKPEDMVFSPLSSEERKDSLSVNVAFVKFHLSRSRKLTFDPEKSRSDKTNVGNACVRFSTIINIGSASFKYDMRRLTEILIFPRAWYRRTLVRRLFLGELKTTSFHREENMADLNAMNLRKASISQGPTLNKSSNVQDRKPTTWIGLTTAHSWETLVIFGVNFKELNVHMNMGNVMGNVDWISKNFKSEGRLSIGSTGHKNMFISLGLSGSKLEAKAGIVGGAIDLGRIDTYVHLKEDNGTEPFHQCGLELDVMEVRFDYMSTSVLMGRVSHLLLKVNDDWHVTDVKDSSSMKPAQIFVQGDLSWDQVQILISKSTTADLLKIINKLEEFFSQQFKSSKKLFSSLEPWQDSTELKPKQNKVQPENKNVSHHRHWQKALQKISGMKIYTLPFKLPEIGSVLGGLLELRGSHISLACFHGINFKSKSWALFSLKDPSISFVSDAQEIFEENSRNTTVIQTLSFSLGQSDQPQITHHSYMATVKKISRSISYLPPIKTLTDWFSYAFKSSELDEVHRFPSLSPNTEKEKEIAKSQQRTEEIFALPCLRMDLKTKHVQGEKVPTPSDPKPVVDCTFVTDFDNHIYVTTDAEAFFFLHDLISSYLKEKERVLNIQNQGSAKSEKIEKKEENGDKDKSEKSDKNRPISVHIDPLQNDWRQFECNTWHLEPTVRLISWAGSQIEPYGIDYILQRLGFNHARTTIPKWLQRGCMDPLDKILSVIVLKTIQVVKEERKKKQQNPEIEDTEAKNKRKSLQL